jgi:hypothetical protein
MSSLASKQGPRYRHGADSTEPYETIGVEKLTPVIGAEIAGSISPARCPPGPWTRSSAHSRKIS